MPLFSNQRLYSQKHIIIKYLIFFYYFFIGLDSTHKIVRRKSLKNGKQANRALMAQARPRYRQLQQPPPLPEVLLTFPDMIRVTRYITHTPIRMWIRWLILGTITILFMDIIIHNIVSRKIRETGNLKKK